MVMPKKRELLAERLVDRGHPPDPPLDHGLELLLELPAELSAFVLAALLARRRDHRRLRDGGTPRARIVTGGNGERPRDQIGGCDPAGLIHGGTARAEAGPSEQPCRRVPRHG